MTEFSILIVVSITMWIAYLFSESIYAKKDYKNEIVSLGILGTFLGIIIGLIDFDINHLESSIPTLLGGLKTAFITSGVGIFCSIVISIYKKKDSEVKDPMEEIIKNQKVMIESLEKSLESISQSANYQVMESLKEIVSDFNDKLNEQFGDNFKELNNAVKEMIVWQENYKVQIQNSENNLEKITTKVEEDIILLTNTSSKVVDNLEKSIKIVKESLDMLVREANGRV